MAPKKKKTSTGSAGNKGRGKEILTPTPVEQPDHPEDIFPIVLTSATQELFGCRADEDVTRESPFKLLKKDSIVQDIKTRAAVSDFSPVKQTVLDYPEDEILLVFDREFTYGQRFYLVLTPKAKDGILCPPQPETLEVLENRINNTPEPKRWISLGSEKEIDEECVKETRDKLLYKFSRVRRKFGAPVCFSDRSAADAKGGYLECASYQDSRFSIKQMQRDCGMQAVPGLQSSSAQTQWIVQRNVFTQYKARELSKVEIENILQTESLKNFLNSVTFRLLKALQEEEVMKVFVDDCKALGTESEAGDWSGNVSEGLMLYQAFSNQNYTADRKVSCINWHPTIFGVIAVALTRRKVEQLNESAVSDTGASLIVFYSFSDPSHCQVVLWDISAHISHLEGTQSSGKTVSETFELDDKKENKTPVVRYCAVSALESGHKAPITDVKWLPPTFEVTRTGSPVENRNHASVQFVTCSPDCSILFWDVRVKQLSQSASDRKQQTTPYAVPDRFKHLDWTWKPLFRVSLPKINTTGEYAPLKFNFEPYTRESTTDGGTDKADENEADSDIPDFSQLSAHSARTLPALADVNTKLYIGTEDCEIIYTDWKLVKDDSGRMHSSKPLHCCNIHHGMVNTVQRSPFFKDIILTIGGWNFAIWKEGVMDGPIVLSQGFEQVCTVGCWSLSRPAVFFIGKENGSIEVWNLLEKTNEPVHVQAHATNDTISSITPWVASPKQHFLAVSDCLGIVRVFEIPKKLYIPSRNEALSMKKYFEHGEEGLKDFLKKKEQWDKQNAELDKPDAATLESEELTVKEYSDYLTLQESILKGRGLMPAAVTQHH
ncbi:dynein axonemal intermediate chain 3 isoform X2 [Betta splendens]|uniref:Dynein axonemal intermediate chain 3 isoform X2 n=1 Tax=Betta splendens TaxID=158456 RepID=A0A9W2XR58_BETSP|nr:dynein axonemal intermediate chain 3 isoform X2 [Betta splendens]